LFNYQDTARNETCPIQQGCEVAVARQPARCSETAILVSMNRICRQLSLVFLAHVMVVYLSGCGSIVGSVLIGLAMGPGLSPSTPQSPKTLCVTRYNMGLRSGTDTSSSEGDETMAQIFSRHCAFGYLETLREDHGSESDVYVVCLKKDGTPRNSTSCKAVASDEPLIGFGNTDPTVEY